MTHYGQTLNHINLSRWEANQKILLPLYKMLTHTKKKLTNNLYRTGDEKEKKIENGSWYVSAFFAGGRGGW